MDEVDAPSFGIWDGRPEEAGKQEPCKDGELEWGADQTLGR
jgi:hypothetical protein